jgi:hypothetical protein
MDLHKGPERRMSERIPTTLSMQIYAYGMLVASGVTVDVSEHGLLMRVQKDYSDDELDPGKHLDVVLEYSGQIPAQQWWPIRVVRKGEDGIAACFVGVEAQAG